MDTVAIVSKIKENLLLIVMLIVVLIISVNVIKGKEREIVALRDQENEEIKKNQILEQIAGLEKHLKTLTDAVNAKTEATIIATLSDLAKSASVRIVKMNQQGAASLGAAAPVLKYPVDLTVAASGYHQIGRFISLIEQSGEVLLIENLNIKTNQDSETEKVTASLTVSKVLLNK